jgi:hypothetical protein
MSENDWHIAELLEDTASAPSQAPAGDDLIVESVSVIGVGPADCCSAPPAFRVTLPANPQRAHRTDLHLCGHHLRASRDTLGTARATVYDAAGRLISSGQDRQTGPWA